MIGKTKIIITGQMLRGEVLEKGKKKKEGEEISKMTTEVPKNWSE